MNNTDNLNKLYWSRYNLLYKSEKHGYLLYNALSNSFSQCDEATFHELKKIASDPDHYDFTEDPVLYLRLLQSKALIDELETEDILNTQRLKRMLKDYDNRTLNLTIAPTTACNFACPYCYEQIEQGQGMTRETESKLLNFINRFQPLNGLSVTWYGGEPLLKFDTITRLTKEILQMNIPYKATMITNGYLLTPEISDSLDELKISVIQVTIDGNEETHNQRRRHKDGRGTYRRILENLDYLMEHWNGILSLRVNVDGSNQEQYIEVYRMMRERYKGKKVRIYPGIVNNNTETNPDISCQFTKDQEIDFHVRLYEKYGLQTTGYYPQISSSGCVASTRNAFVIGPGGEVYKCWHDVGNETMIVGNIAGRDGWNNKLISRYMIGINHYDDPQCRECFNLPICDGGCPKARFLEKYSNRKTDACSKFKGHLPELLDIYYDIKNKQKT